MALLVIAQRVLVTLVGIAAGWILCVALCASTTIQRHVSYLHKLPIWWSQKLNIPESFGFLHNQVLPLRISTSDHEKLYAWLITPLALYTHHSDEFHAQTARKQNESDIAIRLLQRPESRLVIYFHGNAGTVGQTRRTDAYRMITSGSSESLHVLAYDYRGFGHSSGNPTEPGLIEDAVAVIKWANDVGKVPTERIVLVAQSLGTGIASAALDTLLKEDPDTVFAGVCLCAAFTDAPSVFVSYKIGGYIPLLYPLTLVPSLREWLTARIRDKWQTWRRLENIITHSHTLRLTFVAATCDEVIPWQNTERLFYGTIRKTVGNGLSTEQIDGFCSIDELGEGGTIHEWTSGSIILRKVIVRYGGMYFCVTLSNIVT